MTQLWSEALQRQAEELLRAALAEDVGDGDWTTLWTVGVGERASATIDAKEDLVLAGVPLVRMVFLSVDPSLGLETPISDGALVERGAPVFHVRGSARSILTAERTALNFLGRLSGIATLTRHYVERVAGTGTQIVDTRKTTPGWRHLEKWAVRMGGGLNHRIGLHDMVLVKDNHIAAAGGVGAAARRVLAENVRGLPIEIEVSRPEEVEELSGLAIDRILLDNMDNEALRESVRRVSLWSEPRPTLEASGNMTLDRVRSVAETGVEWISVGALTHSARTVDFSLTLGRVLGD
jgi:nicotinate-nucleotide pyrophosphorylase (carboxylating)